jgi:branched-chain amino acid transport system substrate-binding protein
MPAFAAAGAALVMAVAACGSSSSGSTSSSSTAAAGQCSSIPSGPIKVGEILPLSGPAAAGGEEFKSWYTTDIAYFNAHDSICGHKLQAVVYNDKGDPATSLSLARQAVSAGITLMLQDSLSSSQNQIQPYLMQQHVLVITNNSAHALTDPAANPTFFNYGPSNVQYAQSMVSYAKAHGYNDVGILSDGTSFGVELSADTAAAAKKAGLRYIKTVTYSPTTINMTPQLTQAKMAGIKTLLLAGFTGIPALVSGLKQTSWSPHLVSFGTLWTQGVTAAQVPPGTVDGCDVYYPAGKPTADFLTPQVKGLLNAGKASIGTSPLLSGLLLSYSGLLALKKAIVAANSLDGTKVAAAIENIKNMPGIMPGFTWTWSATNHNGYPASKLAQCPLKPGPYDILTAAS